MTEADTRVPVLPNALRFSGERQTRRDALTLPVRSCRNRPSPGSWSPALVRCKRLFDASRDDAVPRTAPQTPRFRGGSPPSPLRDADADLRARSSNRPRGAYSARRRV
jgi:hypothetical protein